MRIAVCISVALLGFALEVCAQSSTYSVWRHLVGVGATDKKLESDEFHGRRANGDTVQTFTGLRRRLYSPTYGIGVDIDDIRKITTTSGTGRGEPPSPPWDCRSGENHGKPLRPEDTKVILGFKVVREMSASPLVHEESWKAPELGCQDLERTIHFFKDGAPDGYTTYTATKAVAAAPDDSLFAIPNGSQEMSSSAYFALIGKSPTRAHDQKVLAIEDAGYERQQAQRQAAGVTLDVFKRSGP